MKGMQILSAAEQIAAHLRKEITSGQRRGTMPGRSELAKLFQVGISSMEQALRQLEAEGLLAPQGNGRGRTITKTTQPAEKPSLRIAMLGYDPTTANEGIFSDAYHVLLEAGHDVFFTRKSLIEMNFELKRITQYVQKIECDAWIVCSAPRDVTEWFATYPTPTFLLSGRRRGITIASVGPDKAIAIATATQRLIDLGHRKIVMLVRPERVIPAPGNQERAFMQTLEKNGITPGPYHFLQFDDVAQGIQKKLVGLFKTTPPTALIVDELAIVIATLQFLAKKRLQVPEDVSLVSIQADPAFAWCHPSIAQVYWNTALASRRVLAWTKNIAQGKKDRKETHIQAEFIDGGTAGPAKK